MTDSAEEVDVTIIIDEDEASAKLLKLRYGEVATIGRFGKSTVVLEHPGISNKHLEMKLLEPGPEPDAPVVSFKDCSSNGTGLRTPGVADAFLLVKGEETPAPNGSVVVLPMTLKVKKGDNASIVRRSFSVRLGASTPETACRGDEESRRLEQEDQERRADERSRQEKEERERCAQEAQAGKDQEDRAQQEREEHDRREREGRDQREHDEDAEARRERRRVKKEEKERHRRERDEQEQRERGERERQEQEDRARHEREEHERKERERQERERHEREELERREREDRERQKSERQEREDQERLKREERDRHERLERERQEEDQRARDGKSHRHEETEDERRERKRAKKARKEKDRDDQDREPRANKRKEDDPRMRQEGCVEQDAVDVAEPKQVPAAPAVQEQPEPSALQEQSQQERLQQELREEAERLKTQADEQLRVAEGLHASQSNPFTVVEEAEKTRNRVEDQDQHEEQQKRVEETRSDRREASRASRSRDRGQGGTEATDQLAHEDLARPVDNENADVDEPSSTLPPWVAMGQKLQWWSTSQRKFFKVLVSKIDSRQKIVIATFEDQPDVWKSVPFKMVGRSDCPLRPYTEHGGSGDRTSSSATAGGQKRTRKERSATPEWWQMDKDKGKSMNQVMEEQERQAAERNEQERKEQDRLRDEKRRKEMQDIDQKRVREAFEKRKKEAEVQDLEKEEKWRQGLRRQREEETALEETLKKQLPPSQSSEDEDDEYERKRQRRRDEKEERHREKKRRRDEEAKEDKRKDALDAFERQCNDAKTVIKQRQETKKDEMPALGVQGEANPIAGVQGVQGGAIWNAWGQMVSQSTGQGGAASTGGAQPKSAPWGNRMGQPPPAAATNSWAGAAAAGAAGSAAPWNAWPSADNGQQWPAGPQSGRKDAYEVPAAFKRGPPQAMATGGGGWEHDSGPIGAASVRRPTLPTPPPAPARQGNWTGYGNDANHAGPIGASSGPPRGGPGIPATRPKAAPGVGGNNSLHMGTTRGDSEWEQSSWGGGDRGNWQGQDWR